MKSLEIGYKYRGFGFIHLHIPNSSNPKSYNASDPKPSKKEIC